MRVNHTGRCAQALYEGQRWSPRRLMSGGLCATLLRRRRSSIVVRERLRDSTLPSVLNPFFYATSFAMGAVTGLLGDRVSLGFVHATEDQVVAI